MACFIFFGIDFFLAVPKVVPRVAREALFSRVGSRTCQDVDIGSELLDGKASDLCPVPVYRRFRIFLLRFQHKLRCVVARRYVDVLTGGYCFRLRIGGDRELSLISPDKVRRVLHAHRCLKFNALPRTLNCMIL